MLGLHRARSPSSTAKTGPWSASTTGLPNRIKMAAFASYRLAGLGCRVSDPSARQEAPASEAPRILRAGAGAVGTGGPRKSRAGHEEATEEGLNPTNEFTLFAGTCRKPPQCCGLQGFADICYLQFCQALRRTIGVEFHMGVSSSSKNQRILLIEGYSVRRLGLGSYDADGIGLVTQILIQLDGRGSFWPRICDWGRSAV